MIQEEIKSEWEEITPDNMIWQPKTKEEYIEGKVISIIDGTYGKSFIILTKEDIRIRTPSHKHLQNILDKAGMYEYLRIVYKGNKPTSKGNDIELYSVWRKLVKKVDLGYNTSEII